MWSFEEDVTPEEAVEYALDGGMDAISSFTENSLNDKEVMVALCHAGFASDVIFCASEKLMADIDFISTLVDCNFGYKYGLEKIHERTIPEIREELKHFFQTEPLPTTEELTSRKNELFEELSSIKSVSKAKKI